MIKRTIHISNPAYLSLRLGQLVIKIPDAEDMPGREVTRPIEDLGLIIIESHLVTITSAVLSYLLDHNVAVVTCDERHMPNGLFLNLEGNTLQSERFAAQIEASVPLRKQLWQQTVQAKITNQGELLEIASTAECSCMKIWAKNVRSGDPDNLEGRAAAFYWKTLFAGLPRFKRGRFEDAPNNLLNYGYAILRAIIARSLVGSGLLPTLGIHHHNRYNAYCLADDIMEPYRPFVDKIVLEIIRKHGYDVELTKDIKVEFLKLPVLDVLIENLRRPLMVAASMTSASLVKCFLGECKRISYPKLK
ncbi:MAG: type II CRISPR-associated endonuclease Cas1 [Bacteroidales bacterium]|nr:type II CRISPR-associated endonuclease Cas1 [Bacteroidales bacterium]